MPSDAGMSRRAMIHALGLVLLAQGGARSTLLIVPTLWCLASGAILLAMGSSDAWVQLPAPLIAMGAIAWSRRAEKASFMNCQP